MVRQNQKGWNNFWNVANRNVKKVLGLLHRAAVSLESLKKHYKEAALVELPQSYGTSLSEISSEFESTFDNLDGLRPVIVNLLEIARSPVHLNKHQVRAHIRNLIRHIIESLNDKLNEFEEENEHQVGLFEALVKLFDDAKSSGSKVVKAFESSLKRASKKIMFLSVGVKGIDQLVQAAYRVGQLRSKECRRHKDTHHRKDVRAERILGIVSQLQEVISDRWSTLHGKFIQMMDSEESN